MLLPVELIDHIFSFLQNDTSALKACSKAHPMYSRFTDRYLYAHINIDSNAADLCHLIPENPPLLDHPRTLEIDNLPFGQYPLLVSIMPMIPRMANLVFFSLSYPHLKFNQRKEFISMLGNCLQQSSFQELHLFYFYDLPFSILDNAKCIKRLKLTECTADEDEPISSSPSSQLSLEALILCGDHNPYLHRWAVRWITHLTTLVLQRMAMDLDWTAFPEFMVACSNSLTKLHLDISDHCYNTKLEEIRFTLSTLMRLEKLSISTFIFRYNWALPEILRVVNTAPAISELILRFHSLDPEFNAFPGQLDWSLLDRLQSNSTGKRPHIDLYVTSDETTPEQILDDLAANEALMDLVKRGLVTL